MLEHEGASVHYYTLPWIHAKVRANEMLNLAQRVLEIYCSNECQNLTIPGGGRVGAGMEAKLRTLLLFDSIYSRPTVEDIKKHHVTQTHQLTLFFDNFLHARRNKVKLRAARGGGER